MKEVERLPLRDFTRYCMSIAQVPTSYLSGLTIEEQLLWLCSFLTNEVIPTVNNNGEAVEELQELYRLLKDYVDNYFDNLDIQEEVNTKLEEMAQSGELAELIAQYLEAQAVIGFNTCSGLAGATNLADGSFARTLGRNTYKDGYGAFYKIRTRINADVPDGYNIIELTNTENLVAERIIDESILNIENNIYSNQYNLLNSDKVIMIGDSYGTGYSPDGINESWTTKLGNRLGIASQAFSSNGAGFVATGSGGKTFLQVLQENINSITNKNNVKMVIVGGGYNDSNYNSSYDDIVTAINTFATYCKSQFPYCSIYIACFGYNCNKTGVGADVRDKLIKNVIPAYKSAQQSNVFFIKNSNLILHNTDLFSSDGFHPNVNGQETIANKLYTGLFGNISLSFKPTTLRTNLNSGTVNNNPYLDFVVDIIDDDAHIYLQTDTNVIFSPAISISGNINYELGTYSCKHLSTSLNTALNIPIKCLLVSTSYNPGNNLRDGVLKFTTDGKVYLTIKQIKNNAWETIPDITQISIYAFGVYTKLAFN